MNGGIQQIVAGLEALAAEPGGWVTPIDGGYGVDEEALAALGEDALMLLQLSERARAEAMRRVAEFNDAAGPERIGHTSDPATWLRARHQIEPGTARSLLADAELLAQLPETARALGEGTISQAQAKVITSCVRTIGPADRPEQAAAAEEVLLDAAGASGAEPVHLAHLRRHADRLRYALAPERELSAQQRRELSEYLQVSGPVDGLCDVRGRLTEEHAELLRTALEAATDRVRRDTTPDEGERVGFTGDFTERGRQRAQALTDVARLALTSGELPTVGQVRPQVVIRMDWSTLTGLQEAPASTERGTLLPADDARAYACDANVRRLLVDADGAIRDLGRSRRVVDHHLRQAVIERDEGCLFPGCDRPPRWCEVHHLVEWQHGGPTELSNLALLCTRHHHDVHRYGWELTPSNGGRSSPHLDHPAATPRAGPDLRAA